jgi:hypothetical protein
MPEFMKYWMQMWGIPVSDELQKLKVENELLKVKIEMAKARERTYQLNEEAIRTWTEPMPWAEQIQPGQFGWNVFGKGTDKK